MTEAASEHDPLHLGPGFGGVDPEYEAQGYDQADDLDAAAAAITEQAAEEADLADHTHAAYATYLTAIGRHAEAAECVAAIGEDVTRSEWDSEDSNRYQRDQAAAEAWGGRGPSESYEARRHEGHAQPGALDATAAVVADDFPCRSHADRECEADREAGR